jgi:hypothetical protein
MFPFFLLPIPTAHCAGRFERSRHNLFHPWWAEQGKLCHVQDKGKLGQVK